MSRLSGYVPPDPFILTETTSPGYYDIKGCALRSSAINPALKTCVLFTAGQSNFSSVQPTLFAPVNSTVVDNFNVYDGAIYSIAGPLLGAWTGVGGPGNVSTRFADLLVTNGKFDRVILVPLAIGSASMADWTTGLLAFRTTVAMRRLLARGITPSTPGVSFAFVWGQGETDNIGGTTQAVYTAGLNALIAATNAAGFVGRYFICQMTYWEATTSAAVRAAQLAIANGTTIFTGGDIDTLTSASRQGDNIHLSDGGAGSAATLIYNAMHASGAPF
jgi:hypothetical protein